MPEHTCLLRAQPLLAQSVLASSLVILIGAATAIHGTIVGRASADAKTSLAYATLTQVGIVFIEIGLGWRWLAVAHILGNATVRTMQYLRAPSMLHDYHQMHSAVGGRALADRPANRGNAAGEGPVMAISLGVRPWPSRYNSRPLGDCSAVTASPPILRGRIAPLRPPLLQSAPAAPCRSPSRGQLRGVISVRAGMGSPHFFLY